MLAAALVGSACSSESTLDAPGAISLEVVSGDRQYAVAGTALSEPLVARVLRDGEPVPFQIVNFRVIAGGGSVFAGAAITSFSGIVQERWTLGPVPGTDQRVEARAVDNETGEPLVFGVFTATALPPDGQRPSSIILQPGRDTAITLGDAVDFRGTATDDGQVVAYRWSFGDGGTAAVEDPPPHTYGAAGTYRVTFDVTDEAGATSVPDTVQVTVPPPAPSANYALQFFGNGRNDIDRVKIQIDDPTNSNPGPPADIGATDFTIEFWMLTNPGDNPTGAVTCGANIEWVNGNIIIDRDRYSQGRKFGIAIAGGRIVFGLTGDATGDRTLCGTSRVDNGAWHHIAVTRARATGALQLFIDGVREASVTSGPGGDVSYPDDGVAGNYCNGPCTNSDPYLVFGAEKHDVAEPFRGLLDEVRLSTVIRYTTTFARPTARFVPDGTTAALYHFDETTGNQILDSSGATGGPSNGTLRLGGNPQGPVRIPSTAPTGAP